MKRGSSHFLVSLAPDRSDKGDAFSLDYSRFECHTPTTSSERVEGGSNWDALLSLYSLILVPRPDGVGPFGSSVCGPK